MTSPQLAEPEAGPPTFDALPLSAAVRRAVDELGFTHPTPVQRAVFEPVGRGGDVVVQAQTGTGKTAAFGLPLVDRLVDSAQNTSQALILAPTRELALQITRELSALGKYRALKITALYGGAAMDPQVQALAQGVHVIVGTPGRVLDHLERGTLNAKQIKIVVLDESDEMLSMGFLPQINAILDRLPAERQTLLFSATVPPDVRRIAESRLKQPEFIALSGDHVGALSIEHFTYPSRGNKGEELVQILRVEKPEGAILFCNTRDQTKRIAKALVNAGFPADWLNAELPQNDRERVMADTRAQRLKFLVATDVAARGIDISHLTHVINVDFPESAEAYIHRTGRTGRAGKTGRALSLITPQDVGNLYMLRLTYKIFPVERSLPTQDELRATEEAARVAEFASHAGRSLFSPAELSLSRRVLQHADAETLVASLLREPGRLRESPPADSGKTANPRQEMAPRRERPTDESEPRRAFAEAGRRTRTPRAEARPDARPRHDESRARVDEGSDAVRVFVSVGRRDGLKDTQRIAEVLTARGFSQAELSSIQLKEKHCFVYASADSADRVVAALDGLDPAELGITARESLPQLRGSSPEMPSAETFTGPRKVRAERARPERQGSERRGPARHNSDRNGSESHGSESHGSESHGSESHGSERKRGDVDVENIQYTVSDS